MDHTLTNALAPVLRDLASAGVTPPRVEDGGWSDMPELATAMLWAADGTGMGVRVARAAPFPEQVAEVADQVQEWAIEHVLWGGTATNWPVCPRHPASHPMSAVVDAGPRRLELPARRDPRGGDRPSHER